MLAKTQSANICTLLIYKHTWREGGIRTRVTARLDAGCGSPELLDQKLTMRRSGFSRDLLLIALRGGRRVCAGPSQRPACLQAAHA